MTLPLAALLQGAVAGGPTGQTYVDDVFSTYLYTGNGSTQTITNGIDLAGKGGMVWIKSRNLGQDHSIWDTTRGTSSELRTNSTIQAQTVTNGVTAFGASGFTLNGAYGATNDSVGTYVSWTFRKAPKFFDMVTYNGTGAAQTISHSLNQTVGVLVIKRISGTGNWATFARTGGAAGATQYAYFNTSAGLNLTAAASATGIGAEAAGFITSTGFKPNDLSGSGGAGNADNINENGATYVAYLFAHDTSTDGIIQCGSFTANGGGSDLTINLGWEPQYVMMKNVSVSNDWHVFDTSRGFGVDRPINLLRANTSGAEQVETGSSYFGIYANGFKTLVSSGGFSYAAGNTVIYLAIRRPNKPPTTGTQVYNAIAYTGSGAAIQSLSNPFSPDIGITNPRDTAYEKYLCSRLRGSGNVFYTNYSSGVAEEQSGSSGIKFDASDKVLINGTLSYPTGANGSGYNYVVHVMRRAVKFMDEICFNGSGANKTEPHGLGVAPELWFVRRRNGQGGFYWGSVHMANTDYLKAANNSTTSKTTDATVWNSTYPTSSVISFGTNSDVNASGGTYDCIMWATLPGVSKVGTYTGNGSTQTINCGFASGARYVQVFRTDAAGDIFTFDTARGIVAGNDPFIRINLVNVESAGYDAIDPDNSGFIANNDATNYPINVNGATYIYLAFA